MSIVLTLWFIYVPLLLILSWLMSNNMIAGHYATALVPYELTRKTQRTSFWIFLVAAQFLDFAMLVFVTLGIEQLLPKNFLDFAFASSSSNMWVSHDILPPWHGRWRSDSCSGRSRESGSWQFGAACWFSSTRFLT